MDTIPDFDHEKAMVKLGELPKQAQWEAIVSKYQKTVSGSLAKEKRKLIERIYELDQKSECKSEHGYIKESIL